MDDRGKSLQKILEASGAGGALTPVQRREILDHLEDSVDEKIRRGMTELEATACALEDLGDLGMIARRFSKPPPEAALLTVEGWISRPSRRSHALIVCCFLMTFSVVGAIQSEMAECYRSLHLPVPALTTALGRTGIWITGHPLGMIAGVAMLAAGVVLAAQTRSGRTILLAPLVGAAALAVASIVEFVVPLIGLG